MGSPVSRRPCNLKRSTSCGLGRCLRDPYIAQHHSNWNRALGLPPIPLGHPSTGSLRDLLRMQRPGSLYVDLNQSIYTPRNYRLAHGDAAEGFVDVVIQCSIGDELGPAG
jgi:hypothetical protein